MRRLALILTLLATPALAEAPRVVADIPPVHSLVAQVMEGVGDPALLLDGTASPHGGSLRPSQARALAKADLVIWVGDALTPWLGKGIRGESLPLLEAGGTNRLPFRESGDEGHDEGDAEGHDHDHAHHGKTDPHAWLDPENARVWLGIISDALATLDPANAATYAANAVSAQGRMVALKGRLAARLSPFGTRRFAVAHDAFHYFEDRFDLEAIAALSAADGDRPGPSRMRAMRTALQEGGVVCLFAEPGGTMPERLTTGTDVRIARLDPLGAAMEPGIALYGALLEDMAETIEACLDQT